MGRRETVFLSIITVLLGIIAVYMIRDIGDIKTGITDISTNVASLSDMRGDIGEIKTNVGYLRGRADSQVSPSIGGKLTSYDERVTLFVEPGTVMEDVILRYQPTSGLILPATLPQGIRSAGYGFMVTPLSLSDFQLPWLPLEKEKQVDLFVSFTEDDLKLAGDDPDKLSILYWDDRTGQWQILDSRVVGNRLEVQTTQLGLFLLGAMSVVP